MSIPMKHWAFLLCFYECCSIALFSTDVNQVPWKYFDQEGRSVSQSIEITCGEDDKMPDFSAIVPNPHKSIFIHNCPFNQSHFHAMMQTFDKQQIERLEMQKMKGTVDVVFEDGYFTNLKSLKVLTMKHNKIQEFSEKAFDGMESVQLLKLSYNKLNFLPSKILSSMRKLRNLDLSNNQLKQLPDDIFKNVSYLNTLRINFNNLDTLTKDLFQDLTNLKVLHLGNNRITNLSNDVFDGAYRLENISLSNNIISDFSEEMFAKLTNLRKVFMSNASSQNDTTLPEKLFANNNNLEMLHLDSNNFVTLPDRLFSSLEKLEVLRLNNNKLAELNETIFKNNNNLREINLDDNMLLYLGRNTFKGLSKLARLQLQNNRLEFLDPDIFSTLTNLVIVILDNNRVNMTGPNPNVSNLYNCDKIEKISLSNNLVTRIYSDWFEHLYLRTLDLSFNSVIQKDNVTFASRNVNVTLTNSSYFEEYLFSGKIIHDDGEHNIKQINNNDYYCPVCCTCWLNQDDDEYLVLDCRQVNVNSVQEYFLDLRKRINLINRLSNIMDVKVRLTNNSPHVLDLFKPLLENIHVTYLSLADNNLTNLDSLPALHDLEVLDLQNNCLTSLNQDNIKKFQEMKNLHNITLCGNPWNCDCIDNRKEFINFLSSNFSRIYKLDEVNCNNSGMTVLEWSRNAVSCSVQEYTIGSIIMYVCIGSICSIITTWSCYRFRNEIKLWMFSYKMWRWLVTEKEIDRGKIYDAFVSYSHLDEWFVANELVPELESGPNPYKLCIHNRDWLAGVHIPDQIRISVRDSRRTIIVLSSNYLASFWAKMEFHAAYINAMKDRCPRVIVIMLRDIDDHVKLDDELKLYLRTYTYIKWRDTRFWSKLKYALPHK